MTIFTPKLILMRSVLAAALLSLGILYWSLPSGTAGLLSIESGPMGNGFPGTPGSRLHYEWMRARNPQTNQIPQNIREREKAFVQRRFAAGRASENWFPVGPLDCGGRTRGFLIDATDENTLWAGQVSGGLWKSTDAGLNFSGGAYASGGNAGDFPSVSCLAQDTRPGKEGTYYLGTGEYYGLVSATSFSSIYSGNGIYKKTAGSSAFLPLPATRSNTPQTTYNRRDFDYVWRIVTDPTNLNEDEVYAAVVNGIWRSIDGGNSWQAALGLDTTLNGISDYTEIAITPTGVLYATLSSGTPSKGIWRSTDGISWTNITPSGFPSTYNLITIGIAPSDENQVYFMAETPGSGTTGHNLWHYRYISGNGTGAGGQWNNRTANIPDESCKVFYNFDFRKYSSQSSYDMYVIVHPSSPDIVFLGGTNIYRSFDGFTTPAYDWIGGYQCDSARPSNYVYPNQHPDQHDLKFLPSNPRKAYSASDGGVHFTEDILAPTVVWQARNNGYQSGQFYTVAGGGPGNSFSHAVAGAQDNGTWFTGAYRGKTWKPVFYGDGAYCSISPDFSYYLLSWQTGKTFKFAIDDTGRIEGLQRIDPPGASGYGFINPFATDPFDPNILYLAAGKKLWRNDSLTHIPLLGDEYNTYAMGWTPLNMTATGSGLAAANISCVSASRANPNTLYYGTDQGQLYRLDSCKSNNARKRALTHAGFPAGAYVSCIAADPLHEEKIIVAFSNYEVQSLFLSEDTGNTWTAVGGNLEEFPDGSGAGPGAYWIYFAPQTNGSSKVYVGTSSGLFSSNNLQGVNTIWTWESQGIGNVAVNMITGNGTAGSPLLIATHGRGIYSNDPSTGLDQERSHDAASALSIYPNPGRGSIRIKGNEMLSYLKVFHADGRLLMQKSVQSEEIRLETGDWKSGMYMLEAEDRKGRRYSARLMVP